MAYNSVRTLTRGGRIIPNPAPLEKIWKNLTLISLFLVSGRQNCEGQSARYLQTWGKSKKREKKLRKILKNMEALNAVALKVR